MLLAASIPAVLGAATPKIAKDAPFCAPPGIAPVFLSPAGEPFRAAAGQPYPSAVWFAGADRNGDGKLTRDEMIADAARFFVRLDGDHDGRLIPDEVQAYERDVAPETSLFAARPDNFYGSADRRRHQADAMGRSSDYGGAMGAGRYAWLNIPEPVAAADQDIDRVVSAAEFARAASAAFDTLVRPGQDALTFAGLPRTLAQRAIDGPCRPPKVRKPG